MSSHGYKNSEQDLDRTSAVPLYEQIKIIIQNWIASGYIKENDRLPTDLELAKQFNVSRITVRKTFELLVEQGIVVRKPGKGTFVLPSKMPYMAATTTSFSKAIREYGHDLKTSVIDLRICNPPDHIRQDLLIGKGEKAIFLSRLRIVNGIPVALHDDYFPYTRYYPLMGADFTIASVGDVLAELKTVISYTTDLMSVYISNTKFNEIFHLERPTAIVELHGFAYDQNDSPVRFTRGYFRGDYFDFRANASSAAVFKDKEKKSPHLPHKAV